MIYRISQDTLWKGIIEDFFEEFLYYFYPNWAKQEVDFSKKFEFLDKELDVIYPSKNKKRFADKLVKVFLKNGEESWFLIHIEVQGYKDLDFPERMFTYFYRIRERFPERKVMALSILTDSDSQYQPKAYRYQYGKTTLEYRYDYFKILDKSEADLDIPNNPFSLVMLTARKALLKNQLSDKAQFQWKKTLILRLKDAGYVDERIRRLLNFIGNYVKFNELESVAALNTEIENTFKTRKNMGIIEAIQEEIKEQIEERVEKRKDIKGIQNALRQNLPLKQIAQIFEVEISFVQEIQKGNIKIED